MNEISSCSSDKIFGMDQNAVSLIRKFCACKEANTILQNIATQILVRVGDFPHNRIYIPDEGQELEIQIPKKMMKSEQALLSLIWEVFNAKIAPDIQSLQARAMKGHLGMNPYAKHFETLEFKSKQGADALVKTCQSVYKIEPEPGTPDIDFTLWNHEIGCHTDKIRERWIDRYQEGYCRNHPDDLESCRIKTENLCDFYALQQAPSEEQKAIYGKRTCDNLSSAPPKIKEYFESKYGNLNELCGLAYPQPKAEL